jgi:hypothetical protein
MRALRWWTGGALALLALVACAQALGTYVEHQLWLGAGTVAVLALMDVAGFVSLWNARRRLQRIQQGLEANPPQGPLYEQRHARLTAVRLAGGIPHVDALGMATAADEKQQAYLGRYVVTVTVLVGLVGTFAGLMETLRNVTPLLRNGGGDTFELLAAPLSGLDVTFGASLVAILVTLALTMVQGDLVLAEEAALARLDEITQHVIIPQLWPASGRPEERTLLEMTAVRQDLKMWAQDTSQRAAESVRTVTQAEVRAFTQAVAESLQQAVRQTSAEMQQGAALMARTVQDTLAPALAQQLKELGALQQQVSQSMQQAAQRLDDVLGAVARTQAETTAKQAEALNAVTSRSADALAQAHTQQAQAWTDAVAALQAQTQRATTALTTAAETTRRALEGAAQHSSDTLKAAQDSLAGAAQRTQAALDEAALKHSAATADFQNALRDGSTQQQAAWSTAAQDVGAQLQKAVIALNTAAETARQGHQEALGQQTAELAGQFRAVAQSLSSGVDAVSQRLEGTAREQLEELAKGAHALQRAQETLVTTSDEHARRAATEVHTFIKGLVDTHSSALSAQSQQISSALEQATSAFQKALEHARQDWLGTNQQLQTQSLGLAESIKTQADALHTSLAAVAQSHAGALEGAAQRVDSALQQGLLQSGKELQAQVEALGGAATLLKTSVETMQPTLGSLAPELHALARELALMAAQQTQPQEVAVLEEMTRLGDGMDRLQSLLRMSKGGES